MLGVKDPSKRPSSETAVPQDSKVSREPARPLCSRHREYAAILRPRADCRECWIAYARRCAAVARAQTCRSLIEIIGRQGMQIHRDDAMKLIAEYGGL